ncbi:MAG: protein-disulfide reductase DsbD family protein, partial [Acidobacteriota bacterium]|nr:protein-disulfide reductase DsbD family protein [Acidobacteriota bacterium]
VEKLRARRAEREFPLVDDKVLTDWNALMISALARAGSVLGEKRYVLAAERAAKFVLTLVDPESGKMQLHAWRDGEAKIAAFVDDYAFLIRALLTLHEVTGAESWLSEARRLSAEMESRLAAPGGGYYASGDQRDLLVRIQTANDGAIPSGNGVAVLNQLALARWTGDAEYRSRAGAALRSFARDLAAGSRSAATLAAALFEYRASGTSAPGSAGKTMAAKPVAPLVALAHSVVDATARWAGEERPAGRPVAVELVIRDGWHVNANPASLDFLIPTRLDGARGVVYPPGETFRFEFTDQPLNVWSGRVSIRAEVTGGATLKLTHQACDDTRCLPPVTRLVSVDD